MVTPTHTMYTNIISDFRLTYGCLTPPKNGMLENRFVDDLVWIQMCFSKVKGYAFAALNGLNAARCQVAEIRRGTAALEHVTVSPSLTVEECASLAAAQNATYVVIENGNQCWYGDLPFEDLTYERTTNNHSNGAAAARSAPAAAAFVISPKVARARAPSIAQFASTLRHHWSSASSKATVSSQTMDARPDKQTTAVRRGSGGLEALAVLRESLDDFLAVVNGWGGSFEECIGCRDGVDVLVWNQVQLAQGMAMLQYSLESEDAGVTGEGEPAEWGHGLEEEVGCFVERVDVILVALVR
ncbi:hypothetical protein VTI74DRAFT_5941 [Chaetomium olivicolor]